MERISITLSEKLLKDFDRILEEKGYVSRSEGIRDAIRSYIVEHNFLRNIEGDIAGTISVLYDHKESRTLDRLTHLQHHFADEIDSTLHIHLDEVNCMEVIVVRGKSERVSELVNRFNAIKGVKRAKLTTNLSEVPK